MPGKSVSVVEQVLPGEGVETPLQAIHPGQSYVFLRDCRISFFEACLASSQASSFAEAAQRLGVDESTLRKRVKAAERYFGVTIFKTRGFLAVTPDAVGIINDIDMAMRYLNRAMRRPHLERLWSKVGRDYKKEANESIIGYRVNADGTTAMVIHSVD
ncbi:helix-turn-helix domain-containing protein [Sphingomonas sp. Mn802worker]|uniref:helix-turn-helix domain-containing protein n=1 Tax=Sphingomonas sp. Mn802worker TaxID=629773 RepID=UPI00138AF09E|nr:LysR family transcriptional regulator [Sphingomonas sp. Mn802worker]